MKKHISIDPSARLINLPKPDPSAVVKQIVVHGQIQKKQPTSRKRKKGKIWQSSSNGRKS